MHHEGMVEVGDQLKLIQAGSNLLATFIGWYYS